MPNKLSDLRDELGAVDKNLIVVVETLYLNLSLRDLVFSNPQNKWDSVVKSVLNLLRSLGVVRIQSLRGDSVAPEFAEQLHPFSS